MDFSSVSDDDLSQMLKDYGVEVGPINVATRSTYERKLFKLKTGASKPVEQTYDPVDDDDDEVELRMPATSTPSGRGSAITPSAIPVPKSTTSPIPTQVRSRREVSDFSTRREVSDYSAIPRVDMTRQNLSSSRKVTRDDPMSTSSKLTSQVGYRKIPSPICMKPREVAAKRTPVVTESKGIPMWVKLMVLLVMGLLSYLIYSNMEESATSNIPHLPDKVEV